VKTGLMRNRMGRLRYFTWKLVTLIVIVGVVFSVKALDNSWTSVVVSGILVLCSFGSLGSILSGDQLG